MALFFTGLVSNSSLSNAPEDISMEEMIRVAEMRWSIEQLFQEGKSHLGMDHYEIRSYPGWHRHMSLVFLIMHFFLTVRLDLGQKNLITLPQAKRLLLAALAEESLTPEEAIELVRYHVRRNEIARLAHRKRKLAMLQNRRCQKAARRH